LGLGRDAIGKFFQVFRRKTNQSVHAAAAFLAADKTCLLARLS
jgi:hypothetical protein